MNKEYLTQLLRNFLDGPKIVAFRLMTQGKENTTALIQTATGHVIVRIWGETHGYMGIHAENDVIDEIAFMDFCRTHDIPVPQLFQSKSGNLYEKTSEGRTYTVMEYVGGESPQRFTEDMTAQVARAMARMHLLVANFQFPQPRSWPGTVLEMTDARIARLEAGDFASGESEKLILTQAIKEYRVLIEACNLVDLPKGVIHGDIMWENMKFKEGQLQGIFDFGDCRESYFVEDIAKSLLFPFESPDHSIFGQAGKNVPVFLHAYQEVRQLTAVEKRSLPLFFMNRFLYQVLGYYAKLAKGEAAYKTKISDIIVRYTQHQPFFTQKSYE
jgi:Ser/Thr protein kinase RdoA (MazF antagonist)